jgi:hypothetical protein
MYDLAPGMRVDVSPVHGSRRGSILGRSFVASLVCLLVFAPVQSMAANSCEPPSAWPLSNGVVDIAVRDSGGIRFRKTSGWDPAYFTGTSSDSGRNHQAWKDKLTSGISTYHVGLSGSPGAPSDRTRWTGSNYLNDSALSAFPTISLSDGKGGTINGVRLVSGYNFQDSTIYLQTGVKVAFHDSAFSDIRHNGPTGGTWIIDSMVDASNTGKGPFRGGEQNSECRTHVMYSELSGGLDSGKAHNMTYYRNHIHGAIKANDGHADGLQINSSSSCAFLYENNIDFLFRMTNQPVFLQNSNPGGIRNTWVVNNLLAGGNQVIDFCGKKYDPDRYGPCVDSVICGNRALGENGKASWASPGADKTNAVASFNAGDGSSGNHYRENNGFLSGTTHAVSIVDEDGDQHSMRSSPAAPSATKAQVNARISLIETWATQIRDAAGGVSSSSPPTSSGPAPPAPPVQLD